MLCNRSSYINIIVFASDLYKILVKVFSNVLAQATLNYEVAIFKTIESNIYQ